MRPQDIEARSGAVMFVPPHPTPLFPVPAPHPLTKSQTGLTQTALAESTIYSLPPQAIASPDSHPLLKSQLDALNSELSKHPHPIPNLPSPSGGGQRADTTPEDVFQARTTAAWIKLLLNDYEGALSTLPSEEELTTIKPGEGSEYVRVALLKSIVVRGLCLEEVYPQDLGQALAVYRSATRIPAPSVGGYPEWRSWNEKALGRFALVGFKCWDSSGEEVDEYTVLYAFRSYHKHITAISSFPVGQGKELERGRVYGKYLSYISQLLASNHTSGDNRQSMYTPTTNRQSTATTIGVVGNTVVGGLGVSREELKDEIRNITATYQSYFLAHISFPKADEVNTELLEFVDQVFSNWVAMGSTPEDAGRVVETMYAAAGKSFHSPRILRYLFFCLVSRGEFEEGRKALDTYLELCGRIKERMAKGSIEKDVDPDEVVLRTAGEGVRVLVKYLNSGKRAMEIAMRMEEWVEEWGVTTDGETNALTTTNGDTPSPRSVVSAEVMAQVYRAMGRAHGSWARQTVEAGQRGDLQSAAISYFKQALEEDAEDVESMGELAMVLAETREIDEAISTTKQALQTLETLRSSEEASPSTPETAEALAREYRRLAVPLWHHLALLLTASEEWENALRVTDAIFELIEPTDPSVLSVEEVTAIVEAKITQIAILETVDGPDAALGVTDDLLRLYSTLTQSSNLQEHLQQAQVEKRQQMDTQLRALELEEEKASKRPLSRYSRFSRSTRKRNSSATALTSSNNTDSPRPVTAGSSTANSRSRSGTVTTEAPAIQITDPTGENKSSSSSKKATRANSVSGGTIRRGKSMSSMRGGYADETDVPAVPKINTDVTSGGSVGGTPTTQRTHIASLVKGAGPVAPVILNSGPPSTEVVNGTSNTDGAVEPHHHHHHHHHTHQTQPPPPPPSSKPRQFPLSSRPPPPTLKREAEINTHLSTLRRIWLFISGIYLHAHLYEESLQAIDEAAKLRYTQPWHDSGEADILTARGVLARSMGDEKGAMAHFENALGWDLGHPGAVANLCEGLLLEALGGKLEDDAVPAPYIPPLVGPR